MVSVVEVDMEVRADRAVVDMAGREDMADKAVWVPIPRGTEIYKMDYRA